MTLWWWSDTLFVMISRFWLHSFLSCFIWFHEGFAGTNATVTLKVLLWSLLWNCIELYMCMYVQVLEPEMRDSMEFLWKEPTIWPGRTCRNLHEVTVRVVLIKLRRIWPGAALCRMDSNLKFIWLVRAFSKYKWMCLLCPFLDKAQVSQQSQLQWSKLNEAPHHMILSLGLKMVDVWRQRR